jgi:hypothetical protein
MKRECRVCGQEFTVCQKNRTLCSPGCKEKAVKLRDQEFVEKQRAWRKYWWSVVTAQMMTRS